MTTFGKNIFRMDYQTYTDSVFLQVSLLAVRLTVDNVTQGRKD